MDLWGRLSENFQYAWAYLWSGRTFAIALGILFALVAIALLVASRTRWGQAKPLTKCVVVSVLAHVWLLLYACGTRVTLPQGNPKGAMNSVAVSLDAERNEAAGPAAMLSPLEPPEDQPKDPLEEGSSQDADTSAAGQPLPVWERPVDSARLPAPDIFGTAPDEPADASVEALLSSFEPAPLPSLPDEPAKMPLDAPLDELLTRPAESAEPEFASPKDDQFAAQPVLPPTAARAAASSPVLPPIATAGMTPIASLPRTIATSLPRNTEQPPAEYQLRQSADRLELARPFGADQDTEAAVAAALGWLARAQSPDGAWNAKQFGGGTETFALGENRRGTGDRADTGVTGLALLAFLSGGHTHLEGEHRQSVQRGLEYLIRSQMPSGDLSGAKQIGNDASVVNARMYCHGIATLALAEAYAMTHDAAVREPLMRAVHYTLSAQDPRGGGWRYRPGDAGDLSQFGWQAMALRSAERSGIAIDPQAKRRMLQFLDSCAAGYAGGLARYRPGEGTPSPTMTAEALACRLLLNHRLGPAAQREARTQLLANLPGAGEDNVYYWYYATLALFQLQDDGWRQWNQALKGRLLATQQPAYQSDAGSWDPDPIWGGYGGRVYSTAMGCLCLEVYYRYLPLYQR